MVQHLTCSKGHSWKSDEGVSAVCPLCGEKGETTDEPLATEIGALDELPPAPRNSRTGVNLATRWPSVSGYEIVGILGRGGMGVVYKAQQLNLGRMVALKMILAGIHLSPEALVRFRVEAQTLARVQHPNIVHIYDVLEVEGTPCIAMEFVEGGSLEEGLADGPMGPVQAANLVRTLARAVHAAHERGIIHRDLKPANILIATDGSPKITDFGLAKRLEDQSKYTKPGAIMGTPHYMAPEQAEGTKGIGPAADVYALGAILYEALTGSPPFRGESAAQILKQVLFEEPARPSRLQKAVPAQLEAICLKCLSKDPGKRYATAQALADELDKFLAGMATPTKPTVQPGIPKKLVWTLAIGSILAVVATIGFIPGVRDWLIPNTPIVPSAPLTPHWDLLAMPVVEEGEAFDRIAFPTRNVGYLTSRTAFYKTEDAGKNWIRQKLDAPGRVNALHFVDEKHGWLATDKLRRTADGGATWNDAALAGTKMRAVTALAFHSNGWGLSGGTSTEGKLCLFRRADAGAIWENIETSDALKQYANWFVATLNITGPGTAIAVVFEGVDGGGAVLRTNDGGRSWSKVFAVGDDLYSAHINPAGEGWLTGFRGALWQTVDGGATFSPVVIKLGGQTPSGLAFDPSGKLGIAPLWKGKVLLRVGGNPWTVSDTPLGYALPHACAVDAECGFVLGADGKVARLTLRH
jgi:serine/threonine protein kinase